MQTDQEKAVMVLTYIVENFEKDFPSLKLPYDGATDTVNSKMSMDVLRRALMPLPALSPGLIKSKIAELAINGWLEQKPQVVERIVEVEKKPDPKVEKKKAFEVAHAAGLRNKPSHNRTELDRDDDRKPPVLTEEQKQARNARAERDNQIIADVQGLISNFTGVTHSKTYAGRDALKQTFVDAMNKGLSAEAVEKAVLAKRDSLAGNNSVR